MGGRIDFLFAPVLTVLSLIRDNRVTAIAMGSERRSSVLPDVPTTEEAGYPRQRLQVLGRPAGACRHTTRPVERLKCRDQGSAGHA